MLTLNNFNPLTGHHCVNNTDVVEEKTRDNDSIVLQYIVKTEDLHLFDNGNFDDRLKDKIIIELAREIGIEPEELFFKLNSGYYSLLIIVPIS